MSTKGDHHHTVPLSVLLKRESANEKIDSPELVHGQFNQSKKGEDFTFVKTDCQRVMGDGVSTFSVFGVCLCSSQECNTFGLVFDTSNCTLQLFDGHNAPAAAIYTKENLLNNVLAAIPPDLNRDEWVAALPRAMVAGFVKTDKDFQERARKSGTTVTFVIVEGWVVSVASVGDSRCILEPAEGGVYYLSADHRLEINEEERDRVTASGGEVGRLNTGGGTEIGPLRCWPGGLCLSRSIGDLDVGEYIVPVPYVKQVKLSSAGGRLIISSDGVWDAISAEEALDCCRGLPPEPSAEHIVKQGKGMLKSMFKRKGSDSSSNIEKEYAEPDLVEELFEEGSAMLSERLDTKYPLCNMFKLFMCAVCQVEVKPGEGVSIHAGTANCRKLRPWDGPFLCASCQEKKDAMEGKRAPNRLRKKVGIMTLIEEQLRYL
ncbi:hypothetical protein Bca101_071978 [Brassica carinata]